MFKQSLVLGLVLAIVSAANASPTWIELAPKTSGPYAPGASVDVDVILHNMQGVTIQPRLVSLDWSHSDAALTLPATFQFRLVPPLVLDIMYARFEDMPMVSIVYTSLSPAPGFILDIPNGGAQALGTIHVGLPEAGGVYLLDALNPVAPNTRTGARVDYGFALIATLHNLNQNLGGGQVELTVVPEPATFALLALGGLAIVRRRR